MRWDTKGRGSHLAREFREAPAADRGQRLWPIGLCSSERKLRSQFGATTVRLRLSVPCEFGTVDFVLGEVWVTQPFCAKRDSRGPSRSRARYNVTPATRTHHTLVNESDWISRKRQMHRSAGVLRNPSMIFRTFLGSTDATAAPPKLINRLKSGNYDCPATGPDFCPPLQGECRRFDPVSAHQKSTAYAANLHAPTSSG
ncbi:MAG: hypothetical protein JWO04_1800 [Gammaproteobacteria bacterium]|nr:hypothetical protein [Gammaproteobacteria bacterium]